MASRLAIARATKAMPGGARPTRGPQTPNAPYYGNYSPLSQQIMSSDQSWTATYNNFLPRPPYAFTQGAFGPMTPILPVPVDQPPEGAERAEPRRFEYEPGYNLPTGVPGSEGYKLVPFSVLKTFSEVYSVARTCIQLRKSEIRGLDWDIVPTQAATKAYQGDHKAMRDFGERVAKAKKFFRHPDPDFLSFGSWLDAMLDQVFVYDALTLLIRPTWGKGLGRGVLGSDLDSLQLIHGATIRPLLDLHGSTPRPPAPAYQQYLFGVPRSDFMEMITRRDIEESGLDEYALGEYRGDQMIYAPMVKRIESPYGFPPIERALIPVMAGLQKQAFQLDYFREGTVPAVYISPGDPNITPNQIAELQDALNAIAGDPAWKHKIIVLPPGSKVDPQKPGALADQFDEIVMTQVLMAFDINPMELGILPRVSTVASPFAAREMAQSQRTIHQRVSTKPTLKFLTDLFDIILHRYLGQDDMHFTFEGLQEETEANALTDMLVKQVQYGIRSVDEARDELELPPWGLPETSGPVVYTAAGPMPFTPQIGGAPEGGPAQGMMASGTEAGQTSVGAPASQVAAQQQLTVQQQRAALNANRPGPAPGQVPPSLTPGHSAAEAEINQPSTAPTRTGREQSPRNRTRAADPDLTKDMDVRKALAEVDSPRWRHELMATKHAVAAQNPEIKPDMTRAIHAELEALVRHLRKGRDYKTWQVRHIPDYIPSVIANQLAMGEDIDLLAETVRDMIILDQSDYQWVKPAA